MEANGMVSMLRGGEAKELIYAGKVDHGFDKTSAAA
jgi:hypothetical protein